MEHQLETYSHRQRSGVKISGKRKNIHLIVTYYAGSPDRRFGTFEAHGLNRDRINFSYSEGLTELTQGIEFKVLDSTEDLPKDTVRIFYSVPQKFEIEYIDNVSMKKSEELREKREAVERPKQFMRRTRGRFRVRDGY